MEREAALGAALERYGDGLLRFCCVLLGEGDGKQPFSKELFARVVALAAPAVRSGSAPDELKPWLFRLAYEQAPDVRRLMPARRRVPSLRGVLPARGGDALLARLRKLRDDERTTLVLGEVESFGCDQIGAVIGLSGDSVVQIATTARQAVTAIHARTGPECAIIREALAQEDRPPLAQRAVDRHLEHCAPCRIVAEGGATLGENLKKSMSKLAVAAVPLLLREGLARANVGGPAGSHAAGVSHRRYLRRRSFAAGAVGGLVVVVAVLIAATGRLAQDGQRTAGPWIVPALLSGMSFDGLVPASHAVQPKPVRPKPVRPKPVRPNPAPIPCSQRDCPPPLRPVCPDGTPAPCGVTPPIPPQPKPLCRDGTPRPCAIVVPVVCGDGSPAPCSDGPGGVRCKDGSAPPCKPACPPGTLEPDCRVVPPPPPPPPPTPPAPGPKPPPQPCDDDQPEHPQPHPQPEHGPYNHEEHRGERDHHPQRPDPDPGNGYPHAAVEAQTRLRTKRRWQLDVA